MIERTLTYKDPTQGQEVIRQDEIASFLGPVLILGDPGLGKSWLTQELGGRPEMKYSRAGTFVRMAVPESLIAEGERIIIDGLDEIASATPGGAVEVVLRQLSAMDNPPFILSCREADWLGAADRVRIEDDYGVAPVVLHLQPFTRDDALTFLSEEFPEIDAESVLIHLASRGIEDIHKNPLTLRMLGEIAQDKGQLPETRAQLFDRACRVMLKEKNPRHLQQSHVKRDEEGLLLAAGAICATQLLCDRIGVCTGPYAETPDGFVNITDVARLPFGQAGNDALKIRLFQAEGERRFTHIHRVIAEFLGAKWLAKCFDAGMSERRIFTLFRQGEGVPTSLRGLHAWVAHFSGPLASRCIAVDPYAVLRYGDAEELGLDQASSLIAALKKLSDKDPYFRSEDWGRHPASGLMREELKDDILAIIDAPDHAQLTSFLLEAMVGTPLAWQLRPELEAILFARDRDYQARLRAAAALSAEGSVCDGEALIRQLLELNDGDAARLAFYLLHEVGAGAVSADIVLDTVLAYPGLDAKRDPTSTSGEIWYPPDSLFRGLGVDEIATLLDRLVERVGPSLEEASHSARSFLTDSLTHLVARALEGDPEIELERLWAWLGWIEERDSLASHSREQFTAVFRENRALRAAFLEHVLLTPCADNLWMALDRLGELGFGLSPTSEDLAGVLRALRTRAGEGSIDPRTWRDLLRLDRSPVVRDAAAEVANGNPELLSILAEESQTAEPEWKIEQAAREARRKAERQRVFQSHRNKLTERRHDVATGDPVVLTLPAAVYLNPGVALGPHHRFHSDATPEERLRTFLGEPLADQVLAGFVAVLARDDLPNTSQIVESHCENMCWDAEAPMICGIVEMLRRNLAIGSIDRTTLQTVYMAWQRAPESNVVGPMDIGPALEAVLFTTEEDEEAHFRTSIEPQLRRNLEHIRELHRLVEQPRFSALAGRLAVEWLGAYPALSTSTQGQLLTCALNNATSEMVRALRADIQTSGHWDDETKTIWLLADYIVDFDSHRNVLEEAAEENRTLLWTIRNQVRPRGRERFHRLSLDQLVFIVRAFGTHWPLAEPPDGIWSGRFSPWDASDFIRDTIYAIASRPTPEATEALQYLTANDAPSYGDLMKHALALQLRARRDSEYTAPTLEQLRAVMTEELPETIDDMRAFFADRIADLQGRMRGSNTDIWEAYWADEGRPREENFCRNRLIEHISGQLPPSIRFEPEMHMPDQTRADIAAIRNAIGLPVEIKGQWHPDMWNAASNQLDAKYACDWRAQGRGVYIVLWFGYIPGKQIPGHPEGLERPATPEALRQMLIDRLPEARRPLIDVLVIDISRSMGTA